MIGWFVAKMKTKWCVYALFQEQFDDAKRAVDIELALDSKVPNLAMQLPIQNMSSYYLTLA